jgi:hypothetical protein
MRNRSVRAFLFLVVVAAAGSAGFVVWDARQQLLALAADDARAATHLEQLSRTLGEVRVAQSAYVAPGQLDTPWREQATSLLQLLPAQADAVRTATRSTETRARFEEFGVIAKRLADADRLAQEYLAVGDDLLAADLVFGDCAEMAASLTAIVGDVRTIENVEAASTRAALDERQTIALAGAGAMALLGALLLVPVPRVKTSDSTAAAAGSAESESVNLAAAAAVCTGLARVSTTAALPGLLGRASALLDAAGLVVWLGAEDELFAVVSHGYDAKLLGRLGTINRDADNATATAWRTGELRTVTADASSDGTMPNGAIVAPLYGPGGCVGVLAVEVRGGREADRSVQAVTSIIAAQLATIVAAWPAATVGESPVAEARTAAF